MGNGKTLYLKLSKIFPVIISLTALVKPQPAHGILNILKMGHNLILRALNASAITTIKNNKNNFLIIKLSSIM